MVHVCEYAFGRLQHEEALSTEELEAIFGPLQVGGAWGGEAQWGRRSWAA